MPYNQQRICRMRKELTMYDLYN